ncbi:DUF1822 family protein [Phormidium tenue FACHB-886]|nr:DUF1822 family protein [Phormidium tenue FACHB-886]
MTLLLDLSAQWLEITQEIHTESWQQSQTLQGNRWQAYLNQVCLQTVLDWLQEKYGSEVRVGDPAGVPPLWEIVNGSVLVLGEIRLVLVPTEAIDHLEFRVPQEWIDIPSWVGDYYLAIEVDTDERSLNLWGYTTHQALKTTASYDPIDRTYCLEGSQLFADLNGLWVLYQLATEPTRAPISSLPPLTAAQAERLIEQLAPPTLILPRLELPFPEWGALLEQDWRQQLCQARQTSETADSQPTASTASENSTATQIANLSRWLQNSFEAGWQAIESWVNTPELAFSLRQEATTETGVQRVKRIVLTAEGADESAAETAVLLSVCLTAETDGRIAVRARVLPASEAVLPASLTLSLLSAAGEVLQSVQARSQDNSIQLRRFRAAVGLQFYLQVSLADAIVSEGFVL